MPRFANRLAVFLGVGLAAFTASKIAQEEASLEQAQAGEGRNILPRFDVVMNDILRKYHIAGGALAITKDGRLVLARGYGLANVSTRQPVRPDNLFCIASITKPITAT